MKVSAIAIDAHEPIDPVKMLEAMAAHGPASNGQLRSCFQDMVRIHILNEEKIHDENAEDEVLVGISPCFMIAVLYEVIQRRYNAGEIHAPASKELQEVMARAMKKMRAQEGTDGNPQH